AAFRSERLMRVTAAIADAVEPERVLDAVVDRVADVLGASSVGLWALSGPGEPPQLVRSVGLAEPARRALEGAALATDRAGEPARPGLEGSPLASVVRGDAPCWVATRAELERLYPELAARLAPAASASLACLPLGARGVTRGVIAFCFPDGRTRDPLERDFLLLVARYAGQALERLRLLQAERALRAQSEAAAARLSLSSRASSAFAAAGPELGG